VKFSRFCCSNLALKGTHELKKSVMRAAVSIPAVAAASMSHSAAVGGSVVGVVGLLLTFGEFNSCELGVFRF